MTTIWNPRRPLNQPPHFGRVGAQPSPVVRNAEQEAARRAINESQFQRDQAAARVGGRHAVVVE